MTKTSEDRGYLLGDGVFDTLVAFNGIPVEGDRHLARLLNQAEQIGIAVAESDIRTDWQEVLSMSDSNACILRTTVTRGRTERGLWPSTAKAGGAPVRSVSATPWAPALIQGSVSLVTSAIRRNDQSPTSRLKSTSYLDNILAAREATARGVDDALLLNTHGKVACSTIANVFALTGTRLATPPLNDGVLAGTMRALVLELAASVGLSAEERSLMPAELAAGDLLFVTNSVRFLRPVSSLDGKAWPDKLPDAFVALRNAVADHVAEATFFRPTWD